MKTNQRPTVSAAELQRDLEQGNCLLLDVREGVEWSQGHVGGCRHLPLGELADRCGEVPGGCRVVVTCASGKRSEKGADLLRELGFEDVVELEGGMQAWEESGLAVNRPAAAPWALERQVRLAAGLLVVLGLGASLVWPPAVFLSWFVGAGLVVAALTNWCGMGLLLAKVPWNRPRTSTSAADGVVGKDDAGTCSLSPGGGG